MVICLREVAPQKAWLYIASMPLRSMLSIAVKAKVWAFITLREEGRWVIFNELQPLKAPLPKYETELGRLMLVSEVQLEKQELPMLVRPSPPKLTDLRSGHSLKASSSIFSSPSPSMVTLSNFGILSKAFFSITL